VLNAKKIVQSLVIACALVAPTGVAAHEGHDHGPSASPAASVSPSPVVSVAPVSRASSTTVGVMPAVPLKMFGIGFLILFGGFFVWYLYARRKP
jgi:hypothetical protein